MRRLEIPDPKALVSALLEASRASRESLLVHKLHCLFLLALGFSCRKVAAWFDKDPKTLQRWAHRYIGGGEEKLQSCRKGRRPGLDQAQLAKLAGELGGSPKAFGYPAERWSGRLLADHLERRYKISFSRRQCQRLLQRLTRGCGKIVARAGSEEAADGEDGGGL
ncbi:hypothetical protein JCM13664_17890 [Methylothermus subterraneus]